MRRTGIVHQELGGCISALGHGDLLAVVSCLSSIPQEATVIDLALVRGIPSMQQVLAALHQDMHMEHVTYAEELASFNPALHQLIQQTVPEENQSVVANEQLKAESRAAKVYIRTGENQRFSNLLLRAGYSVQ